MSIIYAEIRDNKTGGDNKDARSLQDEIIIETDLDTDDVSTILNSSFGAIPSIGEAHPKDQLVTCKDRQVARLNSQNPNRKKWMMVASYDNVVDASSPSGGGGGGTEVISVTLNNWTETFILEADYNGKPILSSAMGPIKYTGTRYFPQLTIKTITDNPTFKNVNVVGHVNGGFFGFPQFGFEGDADQVLFASYVVNSIGNAKWEEEFVYKIKKVPDFESSGSTDLIKGWQAQLLDVDRWQLIEGELCPIYVVTNGKISKTPRSAPWPLDGQGEALAFEDVKDNRHFINFETYPTAVLPAGFDFTPLFAPNPNN